MKFASELRRLRLLHNMTQAQLAEALDVKRSTIGMYENAKREPDFEMLEKIADFFNVRVASLTDDNSCDPLPLPPDEKQLLGGYRRLDQADKSQVCDMVHFLLSKDKYKQENSSASA